MSNAVSLRPSEYGKGGMLDDVDVKITDAKFVLFNYEGKSDRDVACLAIEFEPTDSPGGEARVQYYSAGDPEKFQPSEDGKQLLAVGSASRLNEGSNTARFIQSAVEHGFPEDRLGEDITVLVGTECHVKQEALPNRTIRGREIKDKTILLISKINKLPGEKAAGKASGAGKATDNGEVKGRAAAFLKTAIDKSGGTLAKKLVATQVFQLAAKDNAKTEILKLVVSDAFLGSLEGLGIVYDKEGATLIAT